MNTRTVCRAHTLYDLHTGNDFDVDVADAAAAAGVVDVANAAAGGGGPRRDDGKGCC